jgi:protoporphyrin/coproporphyrin ferrochelatase
MDGVAVILINLGTPDAPTAGAVRRYLLEFLSDRRVVEIPSFLWQPILRGVILTTRPRKSARAYQEVWTNEGSPLLAIAKRQRDALENRLGLDTPVGLAMRYGSPGVDSVLHRLAADDYLRILAVPMYPQYCAATTASAQDAVFNSVARLRRQPAIRMLPPYFDDPSYIAALKANLERQLAALDFKPERLLLSFHGMPERTRALGDPYYDQCQ